VIECMYVCVYVCVFCVFFVDLYKKSVINYYYYYCILEN